MTERTLDALLTLPAGLHGAYLFDLDGTIADSMPLHFRAWQQAVAEHGGRFPRELFLGWAGVPHPRTVELLNEKLGTAMPVQPVVQRKEALFAELLPQLQPIAAIVEVIERVHKTVPLAVVSGAPRGSIGTTLQRLGLSRHFPVVVGAEDYVRGKPDPEPFLTGARRLGVAPGSCLVFEDADGGVAAAKAAGMDWVRVVGRLVE